MPACSGKGVEKDEINVPIALSAFRDGDQGPSKVTKTELYKVKVFSLGLAIVIC